jgi:hypothetical protein
MKMKNLRKTIHAKDMNWREIQNSAKMQKRQLELNEKRKAKARESARRDCLNEDDKRNIIKALRKIWHWSHSRRLVLRRCELENDYFRCEGCRKRAPKLGVDHIQAVGTFDGGYIERLFVPSDKLQGLCKKCHKKKTKKDMEAIRSAKVPQDFF